MEKIIYVAGDGLDEVNRLLSEGWKVKSVHTVPGAETSSCNIYAYVVLTY